MPCLSRLPPCHVPRASDSFVVFLLCIHVCSTSFFVLSCLFSCRDKMPESSFMYELLGLDLLHLLAQNRIADFHTVRSALRSFHHVLQPAQPPTHTHTHTHNQTCPQRARRRPAAGGSARPPCDPRRTRGAVPIACRSPHRQAAGRAPVCRHAGTTQPHSRRHRYTKETSECYVMVFRKGERHNRRRLLTSSDWSRSVLPSAAALHSSAGQIFRGRTASDLSSLPWLCQRRAASMSGGVCSM